MAVQASAEVSVRNNRAAGSYDAVHGDRVVGMIVYVRRGYRVIILHTIVEPGMRGQGIATALARAALDDLLANRSTLTNYCRFIAGFLDRHPDYVDLVDANRPGRAAWWHATEQVH
jgi:uncharacterized protein